METQVKTEKNTSFKPTQKGLVQRKCALHVCEELSKRLNLQRSFANQTEPSEAPPIVNDVLQSPGKPLDGIRTSWNRASDTISAGYEYTRMHRRLNPHVL